MLRVRNVVTCPVGVGVPQQLDDRIERALVHVRHLVERTASGPATVPRTRVATGVAKQFADARVQLVRRVRVGGAHAVAQQVVDCSNSVRVATQPAREERSEVGHPLH
ncbi:MAG: hypothetical protein CL450_06620 [Acidimicrobiaceae bacterium]|nr:hypothetical protein [Acidimicrobiaceae bacterium]